MSGCGWESFRDITASSFEDWCSKQKKAAKTLNEYLIAGNAFLNWLKRRTKGELQNPLEYVQKAKGNGEPTFKRRAYRPEEMRALVKVAGENAAVYLAAAFTGLRRAELGGLQWRDVHLEGAEPFLSVRASTTKNGKEVAIPLHQDVVDALRELQREGRSSKGRVFKLPRMERFRKDLEAAGIPYLDPSGERSDFQALRKTFQMTLTLNGALPRVAMELMRHSDMKLTTKTYTDAGMLPTGEAVRKLPSLRARQNEDEKGTQKGTSDLVTNRPCASQPVTNSELVDSSGRLINTGFRHDEAHNVTNSHEPENGARCRVRTCDFLRVKQALYH